MDTLPFKGAVITSGNIKGHRKALLIQGVSNIAQSHTAYNALLDDFKLSHLNLSVQRRQFRRFALFIQPPRLCERKSVLTSGF